MMRTTVTTEEELAKAIKDDDVDEIEDSNDNILSNSNILTDGDSDELGDEGGDNTGPLEEVDA